MRRVPERHRWPLQAQGALFASSPSELRRGVTASVFALASNCVLRRTCVSVFPCR